MELTRLALLGLHSRSERSATLSPRPEMREMVIYGVSFDLVGKQPIVL